MPTFREDFLPYIRKQVINDLSIETPDEVIPTTEDEENCQKVYIMRHGERVDITFGLEWTNVCIDIHGNYCRRDLNMPKTLPHRASVNAWQIDTPLTMIGIQQSFLAGDSYRDNNVNFAYVYTSPGFRCIQSCHAVLEAMGLQNDIPIRVEPGLFEWLGIYSGAEFDEGNVPNWLTPRELAEASFNIDLDYVPVESIDSMRKKWNETVEEHYKRNDFVMRQILEKNQEGNIFISAHGGSLDSCTRLLRGSEPISLTEFIRYAKVVPYCSTATYIRIGEKLKLTNPTNLPISHSKNSPFIWNHFVTLNNKL